MLTSSVWSCYAFMLLLTTISCISRLNQTLSPSISRANGTQEVHKNPFLVQATPSRHRFRREGEIHELTEEDQQKVVDLHNDYRRKEGASNMKKLSWDKYLAKKAADHAKACHYTNRYQEPYNQKTQQYESMGSIIFALTIDKGLSYSIDHHMLEKNFYDHDAGGCHESAQCSNYFQIVFASTEEVGCAYTKCDNLENFDSNSFFYVCLYEPGWKAEGRRAIYLNGPACSACHPNQWCDQGLCVRNCLDFGRQCVCGSACQHCGTVNGTTCRCKCADRYSGPDCSEAADNAAKMDCAVDRVAPSFDSTNRSSMLVKISLPHLLLIEILLLLCLHNNQFMITL